MKHSTLSPKHHFGFTLLNLLITLAISSILATTGIPSLQQLLNNQQANNAYQDLFTLIQFTRIQSVNYSGQVILCPTVNQIDCINDWNQELMIFVDTDNDEVRNNGEQLLRVKAAARDNETIHWRASGSRRYLRFKADGSTRNQNGRLTYCLEKSGQTYSRQIIVYRTGRARRANRRDASRHC